MGLLLTFPYNSEQTLSGKTASVPVYIHELAPGYMVHRSGLKELTE